MSRTILIIIALSWGVVCAAQESAPPSKTPPVKVNILNVCTPSPEEQQEIAAALTGIPKRPSFSGRFLELRCAEPAKIVIQTAEGKKVVMIDDPTRLFVNGKNGEKMDLTCGPQKPTTIRLEYAPAGDNPGVDGLARAIYFEK